MVRFIPRDTKFTELFIQITENMIQGASLLEKTLREGKDFELRVQELKSIEHEGDDLTHGLITKLNQTFITPFDREDIHRLVSTLDDVLDFTYAAGERLIVYEIRHVPPAAADLAAVVVQQGHELSKALAKLERKADEMLEHCKEINRLENEADRISRAAIGNLFKHEKDPITLIKHKELFEVLEWATDKAEDAANVLEGIVVKSA